MCFPDNLKHCRMQKKMTQKELAELIGVAPSTYSLYESGAREPDVEKIKNISKILSVSTDYLLFGSKYNDNIKTSIEDMTRFSELDLEDQAEIRGEIKQMLKADKYNKPNINTDISVDIVDEIKKDILTITKKNGATTK